jgi:GH24 family phage-related lysozyme (muramidase)
LTDAQLAQLVINLRRFEGACPWMYLDTANPPCVTVGIGVMLPDVGAAVALPFERADLGRPATEAEIFIAYGTVRGMRGGFGVSAYKLEPPIELPPEEVTALAVRRLNDVFLPGLERMYLVSALPWPAQQVLVDMAWNLGMTGLQGFHKMLNAITRRDWEQAAVESHVSTSRPARNEWRAEMFRSC